MSHVRYSVHHLTRYQYSAPAWDAFGSLHLEPQAGPYQRIRDYTLTVDPLCALDLYPDAYGNRTHDYHMPEAHLSLAFSSRFEAEVYTELRLPPPDSDAALYSRNDLAPLSARRYEFTLHTPLTPEGHWSELLGFPFADPEAPLLPYLQELNTHLFRFFAYTPGVTGVHTTALEAAQGRKGVCQDYAHTALAFLRAQGIAARYCSGYLYVGEGSSLVGDGASHAWLEVFLPFFGWLGLDPTNGILVGEPHILVAAGRDYADVAPVTGTRHGGGEGALEVKVTVERLEPALSPTGELD